jgi:hypothetical protein
VQLVRKGPFRSGQLMLEEAGRVGPGDDEYVTFLEKSRDHFFDGHGLAASLQERAVVEYLRPGQ